MNGDRRRLDPRDPSLDRNLNSRIDLNHHESNIDRRIKERDFGENSQTGLKKNRQKNTGGEITGEKFVINDEDFGMPLRDIEHQSRLEKPYNPYELSNPHLDFNLYDAQPIQQKVSYHDPYDNDTQIKNNLMFSNVESNTMILNNPHLQYGELSYQKVLNNLYSYYKPIVFKHGGLISYFLLYIDAFIIYLMSPHQSSTNKSFSRFLHIESGEPQFIYNQVSKHIRLLSDKIHHSTLIMIPKTYSINKTFVPVVNTFASIDVYDPHNVNESKRLSNIIYELSGKNIYDPIDNDLLAKGEIMIHSSMVFTVPWLYSFNSNLTSLRIFHSKDGKQSKKKMMTLIGKKLMFAEDNINRLIELPLSISGYTFGVLINKNHKLPDATLNQLLVYTEHLQETEVGEFTIPVFTRIGRTVCDGCLNKMGCKLVDLQLTNMFPYNNNLNISRVYQTLVVRGLEKGTEKCSKYDVPIGDPNYRSVNLTIDSPFIYYLRHLETNQLIFSGIYQ